MKEKDHL